MTWTKKHDEWCLFFGLRPSTQLLYRWIHRRTKGHTVEEIEIDLRDFNKWVGKKRGRPYDRKTLKTAIAQLIERTEGLIVQQKEITWFYRKLIVKPITFLASEKKPESEQSPKPKPPQPAWHRSSRDEKYQQQQQNIDHIDKLLRKIGLRFDRDALNRVWQLSGRCIDRVVQSIELLLHRNSTKTVANPHGFIIDCLKFNWQEGFELYYAPELPKFSCLGDLRQFISEIRKPIQKDEVELCH